MKCYDLIVTNFHVIKEAASRYENDPGIAMIKQMFAARESGKDILLATGNPSAIRKSYQLLLNAAYERKLKSSLSEIINHNKYIPDIVS